MHGRFLGTGCKSVLLDHHAPDDSRIDAFPVDVGYIILFEISHIAYKYDRDEK